MTTDRLSWSNLILLLLFNYGIVPCVCAFITNLKLECNPSQEIGHGETLLGDKG